MLPLAHLRATPWNIAVNPVMAGARPEYMPIIMAAVQAIGDPAFRLAVTGGSTHAFTTFYWVNGPLARQLGIESGQGLIAAHANHAIGSTISLIERNIAGFRTKETQMGTSGRCNPGSWRRMKRRWEDWLATGPRGQRIRQGCEYGRCGQQHVHGTEHHPIDLRSQNPDATPCLPTGCEF